jgi:cysteine-S-conjugate beta-lyase
MEMQDIAAICAQAHAAGALVLADNTWGFGSSRLFGHGVDIVATALSKYASGHSDVCMGSISVAVEPLFRQLKTFVAGLGSGVSSDDAYLTHRGLHTLDVRLDEQARRGIELSAWLRRHPAVEQVMNPADPEDAAHARFCASFSRGNGLLSFIPKVQDPQALAAMIDGMCCFRIGASWGGTESLVALADLSAARTVRARRAGQFIVRLHLGLEDFAALKADVAGALERLQTHSS